jgi:hypothetical protein
MGDVWAVLAGLDYILSAKDNEFDLLNTFSFQVMECGGLEKIQGLLHNPDRRVVGLAQTLLNKHFSSKFELAVARQRGFKIKNANKTN